MRVEPQILPAVVTVNNRFVLTEILESHFTTGLMKKHVVVRFGNRLPKFLDGVDFIQSDEGSSRLRPGDDVSFEAVAVRCTRTA